MGQLTRQFAEVQNNMNATERVHYYATAIENEAPLNIPDRKPPPSWPERGEVVMKGVVMRYADGLPMVLKDLSLHICVGERIGIGKVLDNVTNNSWKDWSGKIIYYGCIIPVGGAIQGIHYY